MLDTVPGSHPMTIAADKAYGTRDFVAACRQRGVMPHVASNRTTKMVAPSCRTVEAMLRA